MAKRPLPPIGFWSYARPDDELSGGQLSRLRALIRAELQQQYGREPIQLFQDISAISHGSRWEGEIRRALDNSTFFIPILSPNFLQSEWCVQEVEIFQERQERLFQEFPDLPRTSRIFPIHYIDVTGIESLRADVDQGLRELQWFDFREFRHSDFSAADVRRTVSGFVTSVRDLLRVRVEQPETATPAPAPAPASPPAIVTAAAVGGAEAAPVAPLPPGAAPSSDPAAGPPGGSGSKIGLIVGAIVALLAVAALVLFLVLGRGGEPAANTAAPAATKGAVAGNEAASEEEEVDLGIALLGRWSDSPNCSGETWNLRGDGSYEHAMPGRWSVAGEVLRLEDEEGPWAATVEFLDEKTIRLTPTEGSEGDPETWYYCGDEQAGS